jgi:cysteine dioxygenase
MNSINTLSQLLETLKVCKPENYVKVVANMRLPKDDFKKYALWKPDGYARNCIERTDDFELVLICWNPGDKSAVHGHDDQRCWVYQIDGAMDELRFNEDDDGRLHKSQHIELLPQRLSYMEDRMGYHSLENRSSEKAMSLHLYISPIDYCKVYNPSEENFNIKELKYDSYNGVLAEKVVSY